MFRKCYFSENCLLALHLFFEMEPNTSVPNSIESVAE